MIDDWIDELKSKKARGKMDNRKEDLAILKLRHLIARKEALIACANNDLAKCGEWQCDWKIGFDEVDEKIEQLLQVKQ